MTRFKRGEKVSVTFEGVVLNPVYEVGYDKRGATKKLSGYRITVKNPKQGQSWWAVVPANAVKEQ